MNTNTAEAKRQMTINEIAIFTMILDAPQANIDKLFDDLSKQTGGWEPGAYPVPGCDRQNENCA